MPFSGDPPSLSVYIYIMHIFIYTYMYVSFVYVYSGDPYFSGTRLIRTVISTNIFLPTVSGSDRGSGIILLQAAVDLK